MVAINTSKLQRVSSRAASPNFQSSSVPAGAFGGGNAATSGGLSALGDSLGKLALQMQAEDNETTAKAADSRIAERIRRITMGDPADSNAPLGFLATQGNNTLGTFGAAEEAVRASLAEELDAAKGNPAVIGMIQKRADRRINNALDRMTAYASDQRIAVQKQVSVAREAQALADVVADYNNPVTLNDSLKDVAAEVLDRAGTEGFGSENEVTKAAMLQHQSVIVKGAFDAALANGDVTQAQAIFSEHADLLDGPTRNTMATALHRDSQAVAAQSLATEAAVAHPGDVAAQREYIDKASEGALQSATMEELRLRTAETRGDSRYAIAMRAAAEAQRQDNLPNAVQEGLDQVNKALGPEATPAQRREYIKANFDGRVRNGMLSTALQEQISRERDLSSAERIKTRARTLADHNNTLKLRAEKEQLKSARQNVYSYLNGPPSPEGVLPNLADFRRDNPEDYQILSREKREIESLVVTERNIKEGRIFASSSDGVTLPRLLTEDYTERAKVPPESIKHLLTKGEFGQAIRAIGSAKNRVGAAAQSNTLFSQGTQALKGFMPDGMDIRKGNGKKAFQAASTGVEQFISDRLEAGKPPTPAEVRAEAARLAVLIEADVPASLDFTKNDFPYSIVVAQKDLLDENQRSFVTVPYAQIPQRLFDVIEAGIQGRWTGIKFSDISDDDMEEIAGAFAMDDPLRLKRLLEDQGGTYHRNGVSGL